MCIRAIWRDGVIDGVVLWTMSRLERGAVRVARAPRPSALRPPRVWLVRLVVDSVTALESGPVHGRRVRCGNRDVPGLGTVGLLRYFEECVSFVFALRSFALKVFLGLADARSEMRLALRWFFSFINFPVDVCVRDESRAFALSRRPDSATPGRSLDVRSPPHAPGDTTRDARAVHSRATCACPNAKAAPRAPATAVPRTRTVNDTPASPRTPAAPHKRRYAQRSTTPSAVHRSVRSFPRAPRLPAALRPDTTTPRHPHADA